MREFISPILLGALELYGKFNELNKSDLKLVCEMKVCGSAGNGPVDYCDIQKDEHNSDGG